MKNRSVTDAWVLGNSASTRHLSTDGRNLWSYNLLIAVRDAYGMSVYDYTRSGRFISMTTSKHVGLALRSAGKANLLPPPN